MKNTMQRWLVTVCVLAPAALVGCKRSAPEAADPGTEQATEVAEDPIDDTATWRVTGREGEPRRSGPPDIVLVIIDTLRADRVGAYGYDLPTTPSLDRLARQGVRFDQHISTCPWTRPAMATLHTGLYPRTAGIYEEQYDRLPEDAVTLPEILDDNGYLTLGVTTNPNVNTVFGFGQGFDEYSDSLLRFSWMERDKGTFGMSKGAKVESAAATTDRVLELLDRYETELTGSPYFLEVLYIDPHHPYTPPAEHSALFEGSRSPDYDGEIHFSDVEMGRMLEEMDGRGLLDNAIVVVTSDHGEGLSDHRKVHWTKTHGRVLYDTSLQVPLVIAHDSLPRGGVVRDLTSHIDLVPTILDLAGLAAAIPGELPGKSSRALARGEPGATGHEQVFATTDYKRTLKAGIRTPTAKYVRNDDAARWRDDGTFEGRDELHERTRKHLEDLPDEELYAFPAKKPEQPPRSVLDEETALVDQLREALERWERETPARTPIGRSPDDVITFGDGTVEPSVPPSEDGTDELPPEVLEQLRALGYLGDED